MRVLAALSVVALFAVAPLAPTAYAQEQECASDIKSACKDATGKDVLSCIEKGMASFSDLCKKKVAAVKGQWGEFVKACQPDLEKACGASKVADGSLGKCVKENEAKVGNACKTSYAAMKAGGLLPAGTKLPVKIPGFGK